MKRILPILFTFVLSLLAVSCEEDTFSLTLGNDKLTFNSDAKDSQSVDVTAENVEWKAEADGIASDWIIAVKEGRKLVISVKTNISMQNRVGLVNIIPTTNADKVKPMAVVVTQKGSDTPPVYDVVFSPPALTFAGVGAADQQVVVTPVGEDLTWTVSVEDAAKIWITAEVIGGKINVKVKDNPAPSKREGSVIVTTNQPSMPRKVLHVTQEPKVLSASLSVDTPGPVKVLCDATKAVKIIVKPVKTDWAVTVEYPEDGPKDWLHPEKVADSKENAVIFTTDQNKEVEPRSCQIVLTPDAEGVSPVKITINQEGFALYLSDLTEDVTLAEGLYNSRAVIYPVKVGAPETTKNTRWNLRFMGKDMLWGSATPYVTGQGDRIEITKLYSTRIEFNDAGEYYLPDGDYHAQAATGGVSAPNTFHLGVKTNNFAFPTGAWYFKMNGGDYLNKGNIVGGKINVTRNEKIYTIIFDLLDDRGFKIEGTFVGEFSMTVSGSSSSSIDDGVLPDTDDDFGKQSAR